MSRALTPDVTKVCLAQSLLPYLWRDGHLGGRRFSVLMTRLPMAEIQSRLDVAAQAHPERKTLSDFRADPALVAAESEALAAADSIVTPHAEIAALFGTRAVRLEWSMPKTAAQAGLAVPGRIAFPGPTLARKGAYELREATISKAPAFGTAVASAAPSDRIGWRASRRSSNPHCSKKRHVPCLPR
jgi:hypothetical protein